MNRLFNELGRRNVFRVAGVYAVVGWLLIQVIVAVLPTFGAPAWVTRVFIALIFGGFPIALILAWAFEMTPNGVRLTAPLPAGQSGSPPAGRRLDLAILAGLALVAVMIAADRLTPSAATQAAIAPQDDAAVISAASIAVLPFADLSPAGDQQYFADGISEEILNVLANIGGLRVASRTSAFAYKNSALRIPAIAEELSVRHILEGSVRRAGDNLRITAQLIDASTDEHLWSETFDRTLTAENIFAIQEETAQAIVAALSERTDIGVLAPPLAVKPDTADIATLDLYYEANALFRARSRDNLIRAMSIFEDITARDPAFARGWAGLAMVYAIAEGWGLPPRDYPALTREAAGRAIALNPALSSPYAALGQILSGGDEADLSAALDNLNKALALDARDPNIYNWRSALWDEAGFPDKALADFESCLAADPAYVTCAFNKVLTLYELGRINEGAALSDMLMRKGFTIQEWGGLIRQQQRVAAGDHRGTIIALTLMVQASFADQTWVIDELYQAYFDPSFDHAARFDPFMARLSDAGHADIGQTARDIIVSAFRKYELLGSPGPAVHSAEFLPGITADQRRGLIIAARLPAFWRAHGFPPGCKAVGKDDFECE